MAIPRAPLGLGAAGKKLWNELNKLQDFGPAERVTVEEMCRIKDRLDQLNDIIAGKGVLELMHFRSLVDADDSDERSVTMTVDGVLSESRQQANIFKQLHASLRIPDAEGKKPQARGGARGSYSATPKKTSKVSSLDRARAARNGA
ncbi:hypothetical protein [Arthrobacter sp. C152]